MNKEVINTFSKGMIKDIGTLSQPKDSYLDAKNMRLITLSGQSNFTIENIKGNDLSVTLSASLFLIDDLLVTGIAPFYYTYTLVINGISYTISGYVYTTSVTELAQTIVDALNTEFGLDVSNTKKAFLSSDGLSIYITSTDGSINTLTISSTTNPGVTATSILSTSDILIPIGFTTIRDDIYIFATDDQSSNGGIGEIFKLTYDKVTFATTITLIYIAELNFTTQHPIPPSAVEGRYENINTQKLYWTDNFNPPRNINVADPDIMTLDVSLVNNQPIIDQSIPILQKITTGGSLLVGIYQSAYRLKKNSGATSNYSHFSNQVFINNNIDELTNTNETGFKDYIGQAIGTESGKAIVWKIDGLDTDFDRVELVVMFRDTLNGTPIVAIVKDEPIDRSGSISFTYTGEETTIIPITLNDITTSSISIRKCKTLGTKDNRLFLGNITTGTKQLSNYDTRAYRYPSGSTITTIDGNSRTQTYLESTSSNPETSDSINLLDSVDSVPRQAYKANSTTLGGTGINISYEFGVYVIQGDSHVEVTAGAVAPYRVTGTGNNTDNIDLEVDNQTYPKNSQNDGMKYPYADSVLKSNKRDEVYRYAFQAVDKEGSPYFAKWIGDIRMPSMFDSVLPGNRLNQDGTINTDSITDFRLSYIGADGVCYLQIPFIKFTVSNLNTIADQIGGYSIVRCERTDGDKSILGQGILNMVQTSSGDIWLPTIIAATGTDLNVDIANTQPETATIQIPEFLFDGFSGLNSGDKIKIVGVLDRANTNPTAVSDMEVGKEYTMSAPNTATTELTLIQASEVGFVGEIIVNSGIAGTYRNYNRETANTSGSVGCKTLFVEVTNGIPYVVNGCLKSSYRYLLVEYRRSVSSQYGGNTYTARSNNTYISCGHFQPTESTSTSDTFNVLGGDIFTNILDNQRAIKNWEEAFSGRGNGGAVKKSLALYFPTETTVQTELRNGIHVNKDLLADDGTLASAQETFDYNTVFNQESNLKFYNPLPTPFTEVTEFDNRFYASEIKINGENSDSWTIFRPNNYWDVEGSYGPINSMTILRDKMLFWQDKSFGILSINPRVLIQDASTGTEVQVGTGSVIQRHDYISTEVGCRNQWGITKSSESAFWYDTNTKKFYKFNQGLNQLSDTKGLASYFYKNVSGNIGDNPILENGICAVYDFKFNEFIFTFANSTSNKFTLAYNEQIDAFTGFYDYKPSIFITDGKQIFSPDPSNRNKLYIHDHGDYCKFYNVIYSSSLTIISNDNPSYSKVFDNAVFNSESLAIDPTTNDLINILTDTWKEIRVYNDYQNTDYQLLDPLSTSPNIKRKERSWQLAIPRNRVNYTNSSSPNIFTDINPTNKLFGERIRDKYITLDLTYDNLNNYNLKTHFIKTIYRISDR